MKKLENKRYIAILALVLIITVSSGALYREKKANAEKVAQQKAEAAKKAESEKQLQLAEAEDVCKIDPTRAGCNGFY